MNNIKAIQEQDVRSYDSHRTCIRAIHILKNKLGLSEETYRSILQENFNKLSSKDLSSKQQTQLKDMMSTVLARTRCAEEPAVTLMNSQFISIQQKNSSSYKQQNYILFLSKNTINDLSAFCSKIINRSISNIQELTKQEAIKVINALQRYQKPTPIGSNNK